MWYFSETVKANNYVSDCTVQQSPDSPGFVDLFLIRNGLKEGDASSPLLMNFAL